MLQLSSSRASSAEGESTPAQEATRQAITERIRAKQPDVFDRVLAQARTQGFGLQLGSLNLRKRLTEDEARSLAELAALSPDVLEGKALKQWLRHAVVTDMVSAGGPAQRLAELQGLAEQLPAGDPRRALVERFVNEADPREVSRYWLDDVARRPETYREALLGEPAARF